MKPQILTIDIETYSSADLTKSGVYRYCQAPDFETLLFAYAFDDGPVELVETALRPLPETLKRALTDPGVRKVAYNANFERTCISRMWGLELPPEQWECTMVRALMAGLPGSLAGAASALGLPAQKAAGTHLINYFSKPCKPTKANGGRERNLPEHNPDRWEDFKAYCAQDVEVERAIRKKLEGCAISDFEQKLWQLDQRINDRGVGVDAELVHHAIDCNDYISHKLAAKARKLTGLENPNSTTQLRLWLAEHLGYDVPSLAKEAVQELLSTVTDPLVLEVLRLRVQTAKTSVKKYAAMRDATCGGNRIRGTLQFYAANRTGRWGGRIVQPQNLPRNYLPDLDRARSVLLSGDYEMLELLYGNVPEVLSQLIRTALVPAEGHRFIVADFAAIEARIIAWLAGEQWRLDVFASHGKIYEASAAQMFRVPIETIDKGSPLRQKGKVAELALGYQGGPGALIQMGALDMGLAEEELPDLVSAWRSANPRIVRLWKVVEAAAIKAVREKTVVPIKQGVSFKYAGGTMLVRLPSGRNLVYRGVQLAPGKFGGEQLTYMGVNQTTRKWEKTETYGGKCVENIIQAIARDCLAEAMMAVDTAGYKIVLTVHDELVIEAPTSAVNFAAGEITEIMSRPIPWAEGLILTADAFDCAYYMKD